MKKKPGYAHDKAIGKECAHGSRRTRVPNPPRRENIPKQHVYVGKSQKFFPAINIIFYPEQWNPGNKNQKGQW